MDANEDLPKETGNPASNEVGFVKVDIISSYLY